MKLADKPITGMSKKEKLDHIEKMKNETFLDFKNSDDERKLGLFYEYVNLYYIHLAKLQENKKG